MTPPIDEGNAYHEAGHLVMAYVLGHADRLRRGVTIDHCVATCWTNNKYPGDSDVRCWSVPCASCGGLDCASPYPDIVTSAGNAEIDLPSPHPGVFTGMGLDEISPAMALDCIRIMWAGPIAAKLKTGVYRRQPGGDHYHATRYGLLARSRLCIGWWRFMSRDVYGRLQAPEARHLVKAVATALLNERTLWHRRSIEVIEQARGELINAALAD